MTSRDKKKESRSWIVRMRVTNIQDFTVEAIDENEARRKANAWDSSEGGVVETPDWEIISVDPNE
jgi:hypothetical protein